jgi:opacity protein-like surface antigen
MRSLPLAAFTLALSTLALSRTAAAQQLPTYESSFGPDQGGYPTYSQPQPYGAPAPLYAQQPKPAAAPGSISNRGHSIFALSWSVGVPVGTVTEFTGDSTPRGLDMQGRFFLTDFLSIGGTFSWNHFFQKRPGQTYQFPDGSGALTGTFYNTTEVFSLLGNVHLYPRPRGFLLPFVGIGLGTTSVTYDLQLVDLHQRVNGWYFGVSPEVGFAVLKDVKGKQRGGFFFTFRYTYSPTSTEGSALPADMQWFSFNFGASGGI